MEQFEEIIEVEEKRLGGIFGEMRETLEAKSWTGRKKIWSLQILSAKSWMRSNGEKRGK